jgi:hypothetical protein
MTRGPLDPTDPFDRHMLGVHSAQRRRLAGEAGGTACGGFMPATTSLYRRVSIDGPEEPGPALRDSWHAIYALRDDRDDLRAEEEELERERVRLILTEHPDWRQLGLVKMRIGLIEARLRVLPSA